MGGAGEAVGRGAHHAMLQELLVPAPPQKCLKKVSLTIQLVTVVPSNRLLTSRRRPACRTKGRNAHILNTAHARTRFDMGWPWKIFSWLVKFSSSCLLDDEADMGAALFSCCSRPDECSAPLMGRDDHALQS